MEIEPRSGRKQVTVTSWQERVAQAIICGPSPAIVIADRAAGVDLVVAGLGTRAAPLVWLKFDHLDEHDEVSQGSRLAEAVSRALSSPLFGSGLPLAYGVDILLKFHDLLGPFTFVISNAQYAMPALRHFLPLCETTSRLVVVADSEDVIGHLPFRTVVRQESLLLDIREARDLVEGLGGGEDVERLLSDAGGRMLLFQAAFRQQRGLPPLLIPEPGGASIDGSTTDWFDARFEVTSASGSGWLNTARLVDALLNRGAAAEAFELAIRSNQALPDVLVAKAGQHFFDRGLHNRFFNLLSGSSTLLRHRSDELMKWYFSAATAVNRHIEIRPEVQLYLGQNKAPELRALFAGAFPGPDMLKETHKALGELETPITLRMHAFALTQITGGDEGLACLMRALRLSEALGLSDMVMACATDLAHYWGKRGSYIDSAEWARWALDWHLSNSLKDEVRRLVALSVSSYLRILIGDTLGLQVVTDELDVSSAGVPTVESAVSTRGDWFFFNGNLHEAEAMYRLNLAHAQLGQYHFAAVDLIHALVHLGELTEALNLAGRARTLTRRSDSIDRAIGNLAYGLAASVSDPSSAIEHLVEAQSVLVNQLEAPRLAQVSIALAKLHLRDGNDDAARASLSAGEAALRELGFTGWTLLGGFDPEVKALYQMFHGQSDELELHFLGAERIVYRGRTIDIGLRQCECLVVMASRPEGVTAERLGVEVYGEAAQLSTLKAIVSRLRQAIPIENRPYRVGVSMWTDFVELERLLSAGRVREAMSLYRGPLLPRSQAPAVLELREQLDESVRRAVLRSGDVEALLQLAKMAEFDLELYEAALERISPNDPRFPVIRARLEQVRRSWQQA